MAIHLVFVGSHPTYFSQSPITPQHPHVSPAQRFIDCPVTPLASSDIKYLTMPATSGGVTNLFCGMHSIISSLEKSPSEAEEFPISVSTQPGLIVLTVIPYSASSKARDFAAPTSPDFVAEYKLTQAEQEIKDLLNGSDEIILCEAVIALKELNLLDGIDKEAVLNKVHDENQKALIQSFLC